MIHSGKSEVEQHEEVVYVTTETVWRDVVRNQRFVFGEPDDIVTRVSVVDIPCRINPRLRYAAGESLENIFRVCTNRFLEANPREGMNPRTWICTIPTGEAIGIRFVVDVVADLDGEDSSTGDTDTISFQEGFSDDEEWDIEENDYDY